MNSDVLAEMLVVKDVRLDAKDKDMYMYFSTLGINIRQMLMKRYEIYMRHEICDRCIFNLELGKISKIVIN